MDYESQHIAITRPDGGVSIMEILTRTPMSAFSPDAALANGFQSSEDGQWWGRAITDEGVDAEIKRSAIEAMSWRRIERDKLPQDRTFREAWIDDGKALAHDLDKAKDIARTRIRVARDFSALDAIVGKLQVKAVLGTLTTQDKAALAAAEAQRQVLRDAPADPAIDAAKSVDDLKALLP